MHPKRKFLPFHLFATLLFTLLLSGNLKTQSITFSKYLTNSPGNVTFHTASMLNHNKGYLMLANTYNTQRITYVIRTDSALTEVWTRKFTFPQTTLFHNEFFYDVGELLSGNYYMFGEAEGTFGQLWYVLLELDTNGLLLHQIAIRETSHNVNGANVAKIHMGIDSSILIVAGEYEWMGFYRFDQQLNLLSNGFYQSASNNTWGNDCIMLSDTTLLLSGAGISGLSFVKTDLQGTILWTKTYPVAQRVVGLYEAPDKSIYAGGLGTNGAMMCHLDSTGNMFWLKEYINPAYPASGVVYDIYPMSNGNLMINGDSLIFETDTAGYPLNPGYRQPGYLAFEFKSAGPDFIIFNQLYQQTTSTLMPTMMRFNTLTGSTCLPLRSVVMNNQTPSPGPSNISQMNATLLQQNPNAVDTAVVLNYDPLDGCPTGPLGLPVLHALPNELVVFPNPASDEINFQFQNENGVSAEIIDINGRIVYSEQLAAEQNDYSISLSSFSAGVYFLRIRNEETVIASKRFAVVK